MWRWTKRILLGIAIVVLTAIALLYFKQHALVYHPRADDSTYPRALPPDGVELAYAMPFGKQTAFYAPPPAGRIPQRLWVAFCGNGSLALDWTTILRGYPVATDGFCSWIPATENARAWRRSRACGLPRKPRSTN